jgi:hypothetical protein
MLRRKLAFVLALAGAGALFTGCGTTISGRVVKPDGSPLTDNDVMVSTTPRSEQVKVEKEGTFKLGENIVPGNDYTLMAEDKEGNTGYVRGFKPKKGKNPNVVIRMSREIEGKDAVLEGTGPSEGGNGPGEKILKSSQ